MFPKHAGTICAGIGMKIPADLALRWAAGFVQSQTSCESLTIQDIEKGRFGAESGNLGFNLAHMGEAGARRWKEVAGMEWERFCKAGKPS